MASADFWAGYISGAIGILIGNPLDLLKTRLQSSSAAAERINVAHPTSYASQFTTASSLIRGATAPILGYGALNALLFMTYNRCNAWMTPGYDPNAAYNETVPNLGTVFLAGVMGGLATWIVSTPTELIKCREQVSTTPTSSFALTKAILKAEGLKGLYHGGTITVLRDSFGYGVYFWAYEFSTRLLAQQVGTDHGAKVEAMKVLLCGGISGVVSWTSIFPLDVLKTRIQTQTLQSASESRPLLSGAIPGKEARIGAFAIARKVYTEEGAGAFFRGVGICSVRAFVVNAAQWAMYEWIMRTLTGEGTGDHVPDKLVGMESM